MDVCTRYKIFHIEGTDLELNMLVSCAIRYSFEVETESRQRKVPEHCLIWLVKLLCFVLYLLKYSHCKFA